MTCSPSSQLLESIFGFFFAKSINLSNSLERIRPLNHSCREPSTVTASGHQLAKATSIFSVLSMCTITLPSEWAGEWDAKRKGHQPALISGGDYPRHAGRGEQIGEGQGCLDWVHLGKVVLVFPPSSHKT